MHLLIIETTDPVDETILRQVRRLIRDARVYRAAPQLVPVDHRLRITTTNGHYSKQKLKQNAERSISDLIIVITVQAVAVTRFVGETVYLAYRGDGQVGFQTCMLSRNELLQLIAATRRDKAWAFLHDVMTDKRETGCLNREELAEWLNVPERVLDDVA